MRNSWFIFFYIAERWFCLSRLIISWLACIAYGKKMWNSSIELVSSLNSHHEDKSEEKIILNASYLYICSKDCFLSVSAIIGILFSPGLSIGKHLNSESSRVCNYFTIFSDENYTMYPSNFLWTVIPKVNL